VRTHQGRRDYIPGARKKAAQTLELINLTEEEKAKRKWKFYLTDDYPVRMGITLLLGKTNEKKPHYSSLILGFWALDL